MGKARFIIICALLVSLGVLSVVAVFQFWPEEAQSELLEEYRPILKQSRPMLLKKEDFRTLSPWQEYVTPYDAAVASRASSFATYKDAYKDAVSWVWVADSVLNGQDEKWLYPGVFLEFSPNMPANPVPGLCASDCEEQAYSLVSVLRSMGAPAEDVRVCVGLVESSDGSQGGHAWAEIRIDGSWVPLEATSGAYWDEDASQKRNRNGAPYMYYAAHTYPVVEVWGYFNDMFYLNTETQDGIAPAFWKLISHE